MQPESVDVRFQGTRITVAVEQWPGGVEREVVYHPGACAAVRGGIDVPPVLGSRSTDTLSGLGPAPLAAGDRLAVGDLRGEEPFVDVAPVRPTL